MEFELPVQRAQAAPAQEPAPEPVQPSADTEAAVDPEQPQEPIADIEGAIPDEQPVEQPVDENGQPIEIQAEATETEAQPIAAAEPDPELAQQAAEYKRLMADPVLRYQAAQREVERCRETGDLPPQWVAQTMALGVPPALVQQQQPAQQQQQYTPEQIHGYFQHHIDAAQTEYEQLMEVGKYTEARDLRKAKIVPLTRNYTNWQQGQLQQTQQSLIQRTEQEKAQAKAEAEQAATRVRHEAYRTAVMDTIKTYPKELHIVELGGGKRELRAIDPKVDAHFQKFQNLPPREALEYAMQLTGKFRPAPAKPAAGKAATPGLVAAPKTGVPPRASMAPRAAKGHTLFVVPDRAKRA